MNKIMHIARKLDNYSNSKTEIPSVSQGRKPRSNCRSSADGCRTWSNKPLHTAHELSVAPATKSGENPWPQHWPSTSSSQCNPFLLETPSNTNDPKWKEVQRNLSEKIEISFQQSQITKRPFDRTLER